ncbi:cytochrome P450 [Halenospora varia]|nr:cytochrome P450 [Halenospora varia]
MFLLFINAISPALVLILIYITIKIFYRLRWHPLSKYPGPKLWAISQVPFVLNMTQGRYPHRIREFHRKYGPIIRLGPNELSFAQSDAWSEIHQRRPGNKAFSKSPAFMTRPETMPAETMITTPHDLHHNQMRRAFESSFTRKALQGQEPVIQKNVQLFIEKLCQLSRTTDMAQVNMVHWYSFVTFDILGDLAFGEPFGCLEGGKYHKWVSLGTDTIKYMTYTAALKHYPWIYSLTKLLIPKSMLDKGRDHYNYTVSKVSNRMSIDRQQVDFMTSVMKANRNFKHMTLEEMYGNFAFLIFAGSETSATVLSGITDKLIQNPEVLRKLEREIFGKVNKNSDLTTDALNDLPYLRAVISEGFRMCNPTPAGNPRIVPEGGSYILGNWIPAGASVSVHPFTLHFCPENFSQPHRFLPERWLCPRPKDIRNHNPAAMNVFGMGLRRCLGEKLAWYELSLILASMIRTFELYPGCDKSALDWENQKMYLVVEKEPVMVRLRKRP